MYGHFKLTYDIFQARISRDGLSVITFPSLETLGEVYHGLHGFSLEIKLVNTALGYHLTWKALFS